MNAWITIWILAVLAAGEPGALAQEAPLRLQGRVARYDLEAGVLVFGSKEAPMTFQTDAATRYRGTETLKKEDITEGQTIVVTGKIAEDKKQVSADEVRIPLDPGPPRLAPGEVQGTARVAAGEIAVDVGDRRMAVKVDDKTTYHRSHPAVQGMVQKGAGGTVVYVAGEDGVNRVLEVELWLVPSATPGP